MNDLLLPINMDLPYDKDFFKDYGVFVKPIDYPLSQRKIESLIAISEMQRYFQCNPLKWIDIMYNIEMLDAQALLIQRAWNCPNVLACCSRGIGKSTSIDIMLMAKDSLFCNYWCYIASGSGSQAEQTFMTLEKIANDNIDEFVGSTGKLFKDEIIVPNAGGDGFSHNPNGFRYETYNGSFSQTLNSNIDKKRGFTFMNKFLILKMASPHRNMRIQLITLKNTGTLECKPDWKDEFNTSFTGRAQRVKLYTEYNLSTSQRHLSM